MLMLLEGDFDKAEAPINELRELAGSDLALLNSHAAQLFTLNRERGRLGEVLDRLGAAVLRLPDLVIVRPMLALAHCECGEFDRARHEFDGLAADGFRVVPRDSTWTASLSHLAEIAAVLDEDASASTLYGLFLPHRGHLVVMSWGVACLGAADRFLGMLAALGRQWDTAEKHFESSLALEERLAAPPLAARTRYWFARMLLARDNPNDTSLADKLLAATVVTADDLGMALLAEQARALQR